MASAPAAKVMRVVAALGPAAAPLVLGTAGYAAWRLNLAATIKAFATGPGRTSRILLLLFVLFNWKSMPLAWTYRVVKALAYHTVLRKSPELGPRALFRPVISQSSTSLLEADYNLHKSNATYFSDIDVSRSHLLGYLLRPALRDLSRNAQSRLVLDPKTDQPIKGSLAIILGAVECSFRREIPVYKTYEMWSSFLCWDRKWLFVVTHIVPKGTAKPKQWLDPKLGKRLKTRGSSDPAGGWEKKIYATAVSKYVFKLGRLTVHPATVLGAAGLLPDRPGGWTSGEAQLGDETADVGEVNLAVDGESDWRRVEAQRRKGMELGSQLQGLDSAVGFFDGGDQGAVGKF